MVNDYWQAVQNKVCIRCVDGDRSGNCILSPDSECALRNHFPTIVHLVHVTESDNMLDYTAALRNNVCIRCKENSLSGQCDLRSSFRCPLDRYFPRIVEAIQEVPSHTLDIVRSNE